MTEVINRNHYSDWHLLIYVKCNELSFATPLRNDQTCELHRTAETLRGYFRVFFFALRLLWQMCRCFEIFSWYLRNYACFFLSNLKLSEHCPLGCGFGMTDGCTQL